MCRTRQAQPQHRLRATTLSIYEHTAHSRALAAQGCSAGRRHENGIVVLDFGKPAYEHGALRDDPLLRPLRDQPQDH